MSIPHITFVFLDGVGLGGTDPGVNPLAAHTLSNLNRLSGGQPWTNGIDPIANKSHVFKPIDARLGVPGLPQSGTGQATLFTGINCARVAGKHFGPYPYSTTRPVIAANNIFRRILALVNFSAQSVAFANAYPPRFFTYVSERDRYTVTTLCCREANVPIRTLEDLEEGHALPADLTGRGLHDLGLDVKPITEEQAGRQLHTLSRAHAFTLFEYFLTDKAGHSRSPEKAGQVLRALDRFWEGFLESFDPRTDLLVVTSDHGNLEDLSTKTHTLNPVPLIALGAGAAFFKSVEDLTGVTPAVLHALSWP